MPKIRKLVFDDGSLGYADEWSNIVKNNKPPVKEEEFDVSEETFNKLIANPGKLEIKRNKKGKVVIEKIKKKSR